ncbi:jg2091, partial [Pararge aegeria aegeria]
PTAKNAKHGGGHHLVSNFRFNWIFQ